MLLLLALAACGNGDVEDSAAAASTTETTVAVEAEVASPEPTAPSGMTLVVPAEALRPLPPGDTEAAEAAAVLIVRANVGDDIADFGLAALVGSKCNEVVTEGAESSVAGLTDGDPRNLRTASLYLAGALTTCPANYGPLLAAAESSSHPVARALVEALRAARRPAPTTSVDPRLAAMSPDERFVATVRADPSMPAFMTRSSDEQVVKAGRATCSFFDEATPRDGESRGRVAAVAFLVGMPGSDPGMSDARVALQKIADLGVRTFCPWYTVELDDFNAVVSSAIS